MADAIIGELSATLSGSATFTGTLGAINVRTLRAITCDRENYAPAREWASSPFRESSNHVERFRRELLLAPTMTEPLDCFRARPGGPGIGMGPPLDNNASAGRYNPEGRSVLYLSDSEVGASLELLAHEHQPPFTIKAFRIPNDSLSILDLRSSTPCTEFLNNVFWFAEAAGFPEQEIDPAFSRAVAELVEASFDGMAIPGVRGSNDFAYANVVMFRPFADNDRWETWAL